MGAGSVAAASDVGVVASVAADPRFAEGDAVLINELIVDSMPSCADAMRAMMDGYDRYFGIGTGETFFAGPYLDVIRRVREAVNIPVVAYQVSGEFSLIRILHQYLTTYLINKCGTDGPIVEDSRQDDGNGALGYPLGGAGKRDVNCRTVPIDPGARA